MLFLILLACSGGRDTDYECGDTGELNGMDAVMLREWCAQAGQDLACGTDRGHADLATMDAREIGELYSCEPARVAGEHCLELIEVTASETGEASCDAITGTESQ